MRAGPPGPGLVAPPLIPVGGTVVGYSLAVGALGGALETGGHFIQGVGRSGLSGGLSSVGSFFGDQIQGRVLNRLGPAGTLIENALTANDVARNPFVPDYSEFETCS